MSNLIVLASEFIERMSNPIYGIKVNEDYSIRFAKILSSEGTDEMLHYEVKQLDDINALTPFGWIWLLSWVRAKKAILNDKLLFSLAEKWSNVSILISVVDVAIRQIKQQEKFNTIKSLQKEKFEHPWLSELINRFTHVKDDNDKEFIHTGKAENLLIALLQIGNNISLDAASVLLNVSWPGKSKLNKYFWFLLDGLDNETKETWLSHLHPPKRMDD